MSKLISVVGASGVGKTTFVRALGQAYPFTTAYEEHAERPFQVLFKQDKKYALANQLDYLLLRAEQEKELRASPKIGLLDGGLDLDFYGFTRLFLYRKLLTQPEYDLCCRLYELIRTHQPGPELIVRLKADEETVADRLSTRDRINIASADDTAQFNSFMDEWLQSLPPQQVLTLNVSHESTSYQISTKAALEYMHNLIHKLA